MKKKPTKKSAKKTVKNARKKRIEPNNDFDGFVVFRENQNDKNSVIISNMPDPMNMNEEEKKDFSRSIGMITGKLSKFMLEMGGMDVSFKINGEDIDDIRKMKELDIKDKISLAIKEERYEDAQKLKNILENKEQSINYSNQDTQALLSDEMEIENKIVNMIDFIEKCRGYIVTQKIADKVVKICRGCFHTEYRDMGIYNSLVLRRLNLRNKPIGEELFIILKK